MIKLVPMNTTSKSKILSMIFEAIKQMLLLSDFFMIYASANTPNGNTK